MRYARSGVTDDALTATASKNMMGSGLSSGRKFWLRSIWVTNTHSTDPAWVYIYDEAETTAATAAAKQLSIPCNQGAVAQMDFPAPGILFTTGVSAVKSGGTFAPYECGCSGYEE